MGSVKHLGVLSCDVRVSTADVRPRHSQPTATESNSHLFLGSFRDKCNRLAFDDWNIYLLVPNIASICNNQDVMKELWNEGKRYIRRLSNLHSADTNTIHRLRPSTESSHHHHLLQTRPPSTSIRTTYHIQLSISYNHLNINKNNHAFLNSHRSRCWQPILHLCSSCTHHFPSTWHRRNCQSSRLQQHAPLDAHTRRRTHNNHCGRTRRSRPSTTGGRQLSESESPRRPQRRRRRLHEPRPDRKLRRLVRLRAKRCLRCQFDHRQLRHRRMHQSPGTSSGRPPGGNGMACLPVGHQPGRRRWVHFHHFPLLHQHGERANAHAEHLHYGVSRSDDQLLPRERGPWCGYKRW